MWRLHSPTVLMASQTRRLAPLHCVCAQPILSISTSNPVFPSCVVCAQLVKLTASTFAAMFGCRKPMVSSYLVTHWERDPYARGSYSFAKVGCEVKEDCAALKERQGRLFFAGEACSTDNMQCVHGALETGLQVASEVVEALENCSLVSPYAAS